MGTNIDLNLIAKKLEACRVKGSKPPAFQAYDYEDCLAAIYSSLDFPEIIPEMDRRDVISRAITSVASRGKISASSIKNEISKLKDAYIRQPQKQYILLTSLSVDYHNLITRRKISDCTIFLSKSLPKKFNRDTIPTTFEKPPLTYTTVKISVKALSQSAAVQDALHAVDLLRGIWNLFFNHRILRSSTSGRTKPVNPILLGPIHTLHNPDGSLATETFWYEPDYIEPIKCKNLEKELQDFIKYEKMIRKNLIKLPIGYRKDVEEGIIRYVQALDSRDFHKSYLRLWGVLEYLTNTSEKDSYAVTIKRASFMYEDRDYHFNILQHLRSHRNQATHQGENVVLIGLLLFQLKRYVESLLYFHNINAFKFKSLGEAVNFLDLPYEPTVLKDRIQLMQKALRYRQPS